MAITSAQQQMWSIAKGTYGIQQKQAEWLEFLDCVGRNLAILEVGSYDGGTAYCLLQHCSRLVSIDNNMRFTFNDSRFTFINGDSHSASTEMQVKALNLRFDLLFIDGDHSYAGVKLDYEMYSPYLRDNGICAFHDIIDSEGHRQAGCLVSRFWKEIKLPTSREILYKPYTWGGIGIL